MNRKTTRKTQKNLKSLIVKKDSDKEFLKEGQRVKLNVKLIKEHPDYLILTDKYKSWIDANVNQIFTVEYDEYHKKEPTLVRLKEDKTSPKWWFWDGELIVVKTQ